MAEVQNWQENTAEIYRQKIPKTLDIRHRNKAWMLTLEQDKCPTQRQIGLNKRWGGGGNEIEVQTSRGVAGNHKGRNPGRK